MSRVLNVVAALTLCAAGRAAAQTPTTDQGQSGPASEWSSTSGAKTAAPLPSASPLADDLGARAAPPKGADVPLPPPPRGTALVPAAGAQQGAAAPATYSAPGSPSDPTTAGAPDGSREPKVKFAADQTGAMVQVTQDLESDRIRRDWAGAGGTIPAFEADLGMLLMYKDLSQQAGAGAYMNGVGLSGGFRVTMLNLEPPKYDTRDTSWFAWKLGVGMDLGSTKVTMFDPNLPAGYQQTNASMSNFNLVFLLGGMKAFGSFDSPTDWSGFAVGFDWAPSWQQTTTTVNVAGAQPQTSSSFNAMGFDITFESGSMQSMAAKMGKKARMKATLFVLPPVGELPWLVSANLGATWY